MALRLGGEGMSDGIGEERGWTLHNVTMDRPLTNKKGEGQTPSRGTGLGREETKRGAREPVFRRRISGPKLTDIPKGQIGDQRNSPRWDGLTETPTDKKKEREKGFPYSH